MEIYGAQTMTFQKPRFRISGITSQQVLHLLKRFAVATQIEQGLRFEYSRLTVEWSLLGDLLEVGYCVGVLLEQAEDATEGEVCGGGGGFEGEGFLKVSSGLWPATERLEDACAVEVEVRLVGRHGDQRWISGTIAGAL